MEDCSRPTVVHVVNSLEGGGTERMLVSLLAAFDPQSLRHVVVTLREPGSLASQLPEHVACRPIAACGRSPFAWIRLARLTRRCNAAVIHARNTCTWNDAIRARLLTPRCGLVLGFHGLESAGPFNKRQRRTARRGMRAGARFVCVSQSGRRQLHEQAGVSLERVDFLANGVDRWRFATIDGDARRKARAALDYGEDALVIGIVGSLTPVKGHATLLTAVAEVAAAFPRVRLLVVGDGPLREDLLHRARRAGIDGLVRFTGWREDVPMMMAAMDAYVCCSASEGMNNALLEAMAAGLPIVATDVGDNARMIRDGIEGRIVRAGRPDLVADMLRRWLGDSELRHRLAIAARARAAAYDLDEAARRYERYYETLVTGAECHGRLVRPCFLPLRQGTGRKLPVAPDFSNTL